MSLNSLVSLLTCLLAIPRAFAQAHAQDNLVDRSLLAMPQAKVMHQAPRPLASSTLLRPRWMPASDAARRGPLLASPPSAMRPGMASPVLTTSVIGEQPSFQTRQAGQPETEAVSPQVRQAEADHAAMVAVAAAQKAKRVARVAQALRVAQTYAADAERAAQAAVQAARAGQDQLAQEAAWQAVEALVQAGKAETSDDTMRVPFSTVMGALAGCGVVLLVLRLCRGSRSPMAGKEPLLPA